MNLQECDAKVLSTYAQENLVVNFGGFLFATLAGCCIEVHKRHWQNSIKSRSSTFQTSNKFRQNPNNKSTILASGI